MASAHGRHAIVPLVAVTIVLAVSGVHGRHTHDPDRAAHALDILAPADDPRVAKAELDAFFETGWVGWDVKTAVEIECGAIRGRDVFDPVKCLSRSREIVLGHERSEQRTFRAYTYLAWSAFSPAMVVVALVALQLVGKRRRAGGGA